MIQVSIQEVGEGNPKEEVGKSLWEREKVEIRKAFMK